MFVHKLNMPIAAKQNTEVVEPTNNSLKFDPIDQENGDWKLVLSDVI
jgi:hypothetical protein